MIMKISLSHVHHLKDGSACHWVIDPPNGPVSSGKCKKCGETKEFKNSVEFSSWYGSKSDFDQDKKKRNLSNSYGSWYKNKMLL